MCFTNGVIDFKNKLFRDGYPQDYITKCTNIPYVEIDKFRKKLEFQTKFVCFVSGPAGIAIAIKIVIKIELNLFSPLRGNCNFKCNCNCN